MLALLGTIVFPSVSAATIPTSLNVLLVANGYYTQETQIYNHLLGLGFTVTKLKDYKVTGTTNLTPYSLIIITEFAPNIPTMGLDNIKTSGKPVLIVEYWDFWYSYKLGLVTTENCGYVGTTSIEHTDQRGLLYEMLGGQPRMYTTSYTVYGIAADARSARKRTSARALML
ncbi:hypothetical protein LDC_2629 [sediment metagenome]|uniref:Uncharacterized protein n=1 Tax=sediment metagenome TaxID=749907 RepID=D9PM51_9ZZZZ